MKSIGVPSSSELRWIDSKIGPQDSSFSDSHQGEMSYYKPVDSTAGANNVH